MILVKRSSPARVPALSAPTMCLTGSLAGPVMISLFELVLTAVSNRRSSKGASGAISSTLRWKAAEKVWLVRVAFVVEVASRSHPAPAARKAAATKSFSFLPMIRLLPCRDGDEAAVGEAAFLRRYRDSAARRPENTEVTKKFWSPNKQVRGINHRDTETRLGAIKIQAVSLCLSPLNPQKRSLRANCIWREEPESPVAKR